MAVDPLAALAGLHWPADPPVALADSLAGAATGGVVLGVLAAAASLMIGARRSPPPRRVALAGIAAARALPPDERMAALAAALRRYAGAVGGAGFSAVEGDAWLARLDVLFGTDVFTTGEGRILGEGLYRPQTAADLDRLEAVVVRLLAERRR